MLKFAFSAVMCMAMCFPMMAAAQDDGGCAEKDPCAKTRKKIVMVQVQKEVCRLKFECVTDECGCTKRKLTRTKECVTRCRPSIVEVAVDPCKRNCLSKLKGMMPSRKCCNPNPCCGDAAAAEMTPEPAPAGQVKIRLRLTTWAELTITTNLKTRANFGSCLFFTLPNRRLLHFEGCLIFSRI